MFDFNALSMSELLALNAQLCAAIRARRTAEASIKVMSFVVGDRVRYAGSSKTPGFNATVQKVLRVNIDVITDSGKPWRINASMLTKINKAYVDRPIKNLTPLAAITDAEFTEILQLEKA